MLESAHICVTFALFADKRARANELVRVLFFFPRFLARCSTVTASSRCSYRIDYYSYRMKHGRCGECSCKWFLTNGSRSREKPFPLVRRRGHFRESLNDRAQYVSRFELVFQLTSSLWLTIGITLCRDIVDVHSLPFLTYGMVTRNESFSSNCGISN